MASTGTILIRVYTSQARLPVSGAMAAILRPETGGKTELLALRITDESGKTAPVRLATPGVDQGTSPGGMPYTLVTVWVEAPGYGYQVVDLGRDVAPQAVADAVVREGAGLVGLSALMTTTVGSMEETIALLRRAAPDCRIMVGGAVLTEDYARRIGADFYGRDAMSDVRYADSLQD